MLLHQMDILHMVVVLYLNLKGKMSGYLSVTETTTRTDYSETTISGSLKLKF